MDSDGEINFFAVFGANSWTNIQLIWDHSVANNIDEWKEGLDGKASELPDTIYIDAKIKNINKIVKKRAEIGSNVLFIDNELYSYINHLDIFIPVPKFKEELNSTLFFLKLLLEAKKNIRNQEVADFTKRITHKFTKEGLE